MKKKYLLYMIFAAICTAINLGSQALLAAPYKSISFLQGILFGLPLYFFAKLFTGTLLGFATKFILDKFIVFQDKTSEAGAAARQVILYGAMAVITTIIFWGFQISFKIIFAQQEGMDLVGGFIGLAIGYTVKFFLDKKFVFKEQTA